MEWWAYYKIWKYVGGKTILSGFAKNNRKGTWSKYCFFGVGEIPQIQDLSVLKLFIFFKIGEKSRMSDGKDRKFEKIIIFLAKRLYLKSLNAINIINIE